jgi:hypothetical protein
MEFLCNDFLFWDDIAEYSILIMSIMCSKKYASAQGEEPEGVDWK